MPTNNTSNDFLDFNLPQNAYAAFDAVSLKSYIVERLNENEKFTDQNFDGSNLAAVIDIIAYSYHVLLFYLNNTAAEVNFDQATLYENFNAMIGALECCKQEYYRRIIAPYEDKKIEENGDV